MCARGVRRLAEVLGARRDAVKGANRAPAAGGENMQPKYPGRPPRPIATNAFERNLRLLLGRPTPATVLAVLGNRAPYYLVRGWRDGRRKPPAWAAQMVAKALEEQRAEATADLLANIAPGRHGNRALTAWQAHRAAQKEKAGN